MNENHYILNTLEYRKNLLRFIIFFIVWPFGAFLFALYNYTRKESLVIVALFTAYYAYHMQGSGGLDLNTILKIPESFAQYSFTDFIDSLTGKLQINDEKSVDFYFNIIAFFVSRFTINGHVLMMFYGLVYGCFFVLSIYSLLKIHRIINLQMSIVLLSFAMVFSLDQIAGVRYATAAYLFFIGVFNYLLTYKKSYLIIALLPPLIHYSYYLIVVFFVLFVVFKPKEKYIYILIILSLFLGTFFSGLIESVTSIIGGNIESRSNLYLSTEKSDDSMVWYVLYREEAMNVFISIFVLFRYFMRNKLLESTFANSLYRLSLFIFVLSALTNNIPNAGYRYNFIGIILFVAYIYEMYSFNSDNILLNKMILVMGMFFLLQIFYASRNCAYYIPYEFIYFSLPLSFFSTFNNSLWLSMMDLF